MGLVILLALHAALSVAGFALLWRRLDRQRLEITRLKEQGMTVVNAMIGGERSVVHPGR